MKIVTSSAIEFIHSRCDEVGAPHPTLAGGERVDEVDRQRALAEQLGALATMRSSSDDAVGPAPIDDQPRRRGVGLLRSGLAQPWPIGAA